MWFETMQHLLTRDPSAGALMRRRLQSGKILPLIGVFDQFSATIAARRYEAVFCSGYGFAASQYGLPDEGFIAWPDIVTYVERMRAILPQTHIVVDIDDGYGDPNIAATVVSRLERVGASAVIMEDQRRPKRCGHLPGKEIIPVDEYLPRLKWVLDTRKDLFVIARTDAGDVEEGLRRAKIFAECGADAIMIEGLPDYNLVRQIRRELGPRVGLTVNLIAGGKTPPTTLTNLETLGANIVIYSTPCLFAAQLAMERYLDQLQEFDGELRDTLDGSSLAENHALLRDNLKGLLGDRR